MNAGPTFDRVEAELRRRILARDYRPGQRLDPAALAETLASSITPVRDALHFLAGQQLVDAETGEGFHVPHIDEPGLKDLYAWNLQLLSCAIRSWPRRSETGVAMPDADQVGDIAGLSAAIAARSVNQEHRLAVRLLSDRLAPYRTVEPVVLEADDGEIAALETARGSGDARALRQLLVRYHARRQRQAARIVRAFYRA